MAKSFILTTSGFILPSTHYYNAVDPNTFSNTSIFNRSTDISSNETISEFAKTNTLHHSKTADEAVKQVENDESFVKFITLVDIATEVLSEVNFYSFFEIQANNRNMSPVNFHVCLELLSGNFKQNYLQYYALPGSVRFNTETNVPNTQVADNLNKLKNAKSMAALLTWDKFIADLARDRNVFAAFFKHVFVDAY
jgi:Glu-tRNA(Gln) amidotransferase subunit E-like FAD-binding protein